MTIHIRPATSADDLYAVWSEVYAVDHKPILPAGVDVPFEPRGTAYVATDGTELLGFCYVEAEWLDELWVRKASQRQGIGTALLLHAEDAIRAAGIDVATLSVLAANDRAVAFYGCHGWIEAHRWVHQATGLHYLHLEKPLQPPR